MTDAIAILVLCSLNICFGISRKYIDTPRNVLIQRIIARPLISIATLFQKRYPLIPTLGTLDFPIVRGGLVVGLCRPCCRLFACRSCKNKGDRY